jgi:hypothetical protein
VSVTKRLIRGLRNRKAPEIAGMCTMFLVVFLTTIGLMQRLADDGGHEDAEEEQREPVSRAAGSAVAGRREQSRWRVDSERFAYPFVRGQTAVR